MSFHYYNDYNKKRGAPLALFVSGLFAKNLMLIAAATVVYSTVYVVATKCCGYLWLPTIIINQLRGTLYTNG